MWYSHSFHENVPSSHTCLDSDEQEQSLFMIMDMEASFCAWDILHANLI
jgi:hypothetical protein